MTSPERLRKRENYRRWYQRHRHEHLKALRKRRRTDPDYASRRRASAYKYFDERRDEINAGRRGRKQDDQAFAKRTRDYSAAYWEKLKSGYIPQPLPIYDGPQRLYRQSEAARLAGCSAAAIIKWLRHGWLPEPHRKSGRRLFTFAHVNLITLFHSINSHDHDARSAASKLIFENW